MSVYVRVSALSRPSFLGVTRHPASRLSQPLFKKFTQTRWAKPVETLEEIIATVGVSLPEFSELQDCFREVRTGAWGKSGPPRQLAVSIPYTHTCSHKHTEMQAPKLTLWPVCSPGFLPWKLQFRGGDGPLGVGVSGWLTPSGICLPRSSWRPCTCTW